MHVLALIPLGLLFAGSLLAQKQKSEPLTDAQVEEIREAGIDPEARINLYTKFLDEHAAVIKGFAGRAHSAARGSRLDEELQEFTALMDELGSNLDTYSDRHADIRKALKPLTEATPRWLTMLRELTGEPAFELARKEAIESGKDLDEQATGMLHEQTDYFTLHKDEKGQERAEPK